MNHLIDYSLPCSVCSLLILDSGGMSIIAFTIVGSTSMPRLEIMYPRSFPDYTPNTHFLGLSLTLYSSSLLKILSRTCK